MSTTLVRRSARLAKSCSVLGTVYVQLKVEKPKAQLSLENPVKFYLDGMKPISAEDEWAEDRIVWDPIVGECYDTVTVDIYFEEHDGSCEEPRAWFTEPELTNTIYLQRIGEMPFEALHRPWSELNDRHKGCRAKIHYIVRKVEQMAMFERERTSSCFCKACGAGVDFMEFCPCQEEVCEDYEDICSWDSENGDFDDDP